MDENIILYEKKGHIALITLNRPPANAVNYPMIEAINNALDDIEKDRNVRVVLISSSNEKNFCAGFDVTEFHSGRGDLCRIHGNLTWTRIDRLNKPVITAINGPALGGGFEMALASDYVFMIDSPKAVMGLTEINLGLLPGWGGCVRLTRAVGHKKAQDHILWSKKISGQEALELGLIDRLCAPENLMKEAMEFAEAIAARAPIAVEVMMNAINTSIYEGMDKGLEAERDGVTKVAVTKDMAEGFTALLEKRAPVFKGE